jgi:hypothetical protein
VELHIQQARGVVGALQEGAQAHEVQASSCSMVPTVTPRDRCERNFTHSKNCRVALEGVRP